MNETMIERVAKAIAEYYWNNIEDADSSWANYRYPKGPDQYYQNNHTLFIGYARAAIEAMREPTEAIVNSALGHPIAMDWDTHSYALDRKDASFIWDKMIDAAIKDERIK